MKVIEIKYQGELYQRYDNPQDKDAVIRWKQGNMKVYDQLPGGTWIEWKLTGRWMNKLQWDICEEPDVEKYYQSIRK
jgi:hypothetical protein